MLSKVVLAVMVVMAMAMLLMEETTTPAATVEMGVLPLATTEMVVLEALQLAVNTSLSRAFTVQFIANGIWCFLPILFLT